MYGLLGLGDATSIMLCINAGADIKSTRKLTKLKWKKILAILTLFLLHVFSNIEYKKVSSYYYFLYIGLQ